MIYHIIRTKDGKEWYLENPAFVRKTSDSVYCLTNEADAHAVYIEGICYHIAGRAPIFDLDDVMVGIAHGDVYSNVEVKELLDSHTETFADTDQLILDHEERLILLEVNE